MMFAPNPIPSRITHHMWAFWQECQVIMGATVAYGGIYANKRGYHNTRAANEANWPGNYSIRLAADQQGPDDKAAAHDLTYPSAQAGNYAVIRVYSARLLAAGRSGDPRGNYLREFYGQADADSNVEGYDYVYNREVTSDPRHLWHIHLSWLRMYVQDPAAFRAVLSVLRGESLAAWRAHEAVIAAARPVPGSRVLRYIGPDADNQMQHGQDVETVQRRVGAFPDGWYGPKTETAVKVWQLGRKLTVDGVTGPQTWASVLVR